MILSKEPYLVGCDKRRHKPPVRFSSPTLARQNGPVCLLILHRTPARTESKGELWLNLGKLIQQKKHSTQASLMVLCLSQYT